VIGQTDMAEDELDTYARLAKELVDISIERATDLLGYTMPKTCSYSDLPWQISYEERDDTSAIPAEPQPNVLWPTIEDFTPELGEEKILEFVQTWQFDESWLYHISMIEMDDKEFDVRYRYRVLWSIPTRRKPIPRATAAVYFTILVSKIKAPNTTIVSVFYVFETNRLVHRPGQSRFQEQWLKDIIINKCMLCDRINL